MPAKVRPVPERGQRRGAVAQAVLTRRPPFARGESERARAGVGERARSDADVRVLDRAWLRFSGGYSRRLGLSEPVAITARPSRSRRAVRELLARPRSVSIIGSGINLGQGREGAQYAPKVFRAAGLLEMIGNLGWRVRDTGDLDFGMHSDRSARCEGAGTAGIRNAALLGPALRRIAARSHAAAEARRFALAIGGDHSAALGTISGALRARPDLSVIWVDAHGDFNSPATSPSGNFHGMPLAALCGAFDLSSVPGFEWFKPSLDPRRVAIIGARSLDAGERALLRRHGVHVFTMADIDRYGIARVMDAAMARVNPGGDRPLHLSFDIDAVDAALAPSTGTRERGGLTYREARFIGEASAQSGCLVSMDLVEVNPKLSPDRALADSVESNAPCIPRRGEDADPTIEVALDVIAAALGRTLY